MYKLTYTRVHNKILMFYDTHPYPLFYPYIFLCADRHILFTLTYYGYRVDSENPEMRNYSWNNLFYKK